MNNKFMLSVLTTFLLLFSFFPLAFGQENVLNANLKWHLSDPDPDCSYTFTPSAGDVDGDGNMEIVYVCVYSGELRVLKLLENGETSIIYRYNLDIKIPKNQLSTNIHPLLYDMDNDGRLEIVVGGKGGVVVLQPFQQPQPEVLWEYQTPENLILLNLAIGNLDGNSFPDVVGVKYNISDVNSPNEVFAISEGILLWNYIPDPRVTDSYPPVLADLDKDNKDEALFISGGFRQVQNLIVLKDGDKIASWPAPDGVYLTGIPAVADLDPGDNNHLNIVIGSATGTLYCLNVTDDGFEPRWEHPGPGTQAGRPYSAPVIARFQENDPYVIVYAGSGNLDFINAIDGTELFSLPIPKEFLPLQTVSPALADLDQDHQLEVVIGAAGEYQIYDFFDRKLLYSFKEGSNGINFTIDTLHSNPVIADFDNNGKLDIAFSFNEYPQRTNGHLAVLESVDSGIDINNPQEVYPWITFQGNARRTGLYGDHDPFPRSIWPQYIRGDSNADGKIDLSDAVFNLLFLFVGGKEPSCLDAANANGDDSLNISDAIYLLRHLFLGGPDMPKPNMCGIPVRTLLGCKDSPCQ